MMSTVLGMLMMMPVVFGAVGTRWCPDDHEHAMRTTRVCLGPEASHFETLVHLTLRRSPSARGVVMNCMSHCFDGRRGEMR